MGDREKAQRADILGRPDEAEIDAAGLKVADDVVGGAVPRAAEGYDGLWDLTAPDILVEVKFGRGRGAHSRGQEFFARLDTAATPYAIRIRQDLSGQMEMS